MKDTSTNKVKLSLEKITDSGRVLPGNSAPQLRSPLAMSWKKVVPMLVVQPKTIKEVQKIVKFANRNGITLVPRSSTTSFSQISAPAAKWVLVDMSRMNSILSIDKRNRAVKIEPGVRWGTLQSELKKVGFRGLMPLLPHPNKSALAGYIDREPLVIPKFEYSEPILTMEVVLPNGKIFRTGSASGPTSPKKTKAAMVGPYGPSTMDFFRLFQGSQGTTGIATWVNVKIEPLPHLQKMFTIPCEDLQQAVQALYQIQRKMIGYECVVLDSRNMAAISDTAGGAVDTAPWTIFLCLGGGKRHPEKKIAYEEEALMLVASETGIKAVESEDTSMADILQAPWKENTLYKHKAKGDSLDLYFITTMNRAKGITGRFNQLAESFGITPDEVGTYLQPIEYGRACHLEFNVPFSRESDAESKNVRKMAVEATGVIMREGGFFSRPIGIQTEELMKRGQSFYKSAEKMQTILDPKGIMNPGVL